MRVRFADSCNYILYYISTSECRCYTAAVYACTDLQTNSLLIVLYRLSPIYILTSTIILLSSKIGFRFAKITFQTAVRRLYAASEENIIIGT